MSSDAKSEYNSHFYDAHYPNRTKTNGQDLDFVVVFLQCMQMRVHLALVLLLLLHWPANLLNRQEQEDRGRNRTKLFFSALIYLSRVAPLPRVYGHCSFISRYPIKA